jgi:hypothetical protein
VNETSDAEGYALSALLLFKELGGGAKKGAGVPCNVKSGLINPKRLFNWGCTIQVSDYDYCRSTT